MKEQFVAVALTILGVVAVQAQITTPITFTVNKPFVAGNATLPAGQYEIKPLDDDPSVLEVVAQSGSHTVMVETTPTQSASAARETSVSFKAYGNVLVLKSIAIEGERAGAELVPAHPEKKHQKASGPPQTTTMPASKSGK